MSLRFANPEEADELARLHASAFEAPWPAKDIARLMTMMGGFAVVAEGEGPQGFILARAIAEEGEILTLAVDPAARRRGVGRSRVEAAAAEAGRRGARTLFLEVAADNEPARGLYEAAGFERAGLRKAYYARPGSRRADALVLRRPLNRQGA